MRTKKQYALESLRANAHELLCNITEFEEAQNADAGARLLLFCSLLCSAARLWGQALRVNDLFFKQSYALENERTLAIVVVKHRYWESEHWNPKTQSEVWTEALDEGV
jgi:hypothetical protein